MIKTLPAYQQSALRMLQNHLGLSYELGFSLDENDAEERRQEDLVTDPS